MLGTEPAAEQQSRIEWWRQVIARQQSAQITVAQFCRELGITTRKFSYWRKRVREAPAGSARRIAAPAASRPPAASARGEAVGFVPVSIIDAGTTAELEVKLANGCAVRLRGSVNPGLLQAAIAAAGRVGGSSRGGR